MKKNKCYIFLIVSLFAIALMSSLTFISFAGEISDVEVTPYGNISQSDYPLNTYPLVLFQDGKVVKGYTSYYDFLLGASSVKTDSVLYLRRDINTEDENYAVKNTDRNLNKITAPLTIDLGGNTLTRGATFKKQVLQAYGVNGGDMRIYDITVKNGYLHANNTLIYFNNLYNQDDSLPPEETFNFTLENVKITVKSGFSNSLVAAGADGNGSIGNVVFRGCTLDFRGASSSIQPFKLNDTDNNVDVSVTIDGGEIITDGNPTLASFSSERDGVVPDSLNFSCTDGAYPTFRRPSTVAAPTNLYGRTDLVFIKYQEDGEYATYRLIPRSGQNIDFTPRVSITLDSQIRLNVYVPNDPRLAQFTIDGERYVSAPIEDGYYVVSVSLPAPEAARDIILRVRLNIEGVDFFGSFTLSTLKYAKKLLEKDSDFKTEQALVSDVLCYIRSAYVYFECEDSLEVLSRIDEILGGYEPSFEPIDGEGDTVVDALGATLVLDSPPAIRFVFDEATDLTAYSFIQDGKQVPYKAGKTNIDGVTYACADLSLYAYRMIDEVSLYLADTYLGSFHINDYYAYAQMQGDTALVDLVEKFYIYCKGALAYRNEIIKVESGTIDINKYTIVYESGASDDVVSRANKLQQIINSHLGVMLPIMDDSSDATGAEILIGRTNRESSSELFGTLSGHDYKDVYSVEIKDEQILLLGISDLSTRRAVDLFISKYVTPSEYQGRIDLSQGRLSVVPYEVVDTIKIDGGVEVDVEIVSDVFGITQNGYTEELGYATYVNTAHYPSVIELKHNGENNGTILAIFRIGDKPKDDGAPNTNGCVMQSVDGGKTFKVIARPAETIDTSIMGISMAHLYELPADVGDMPAGTILYSGTSVDYDRKSHIAVWRSFDCGYTWEEYVVIDEGGGTKEGVWEPLMWYEESDGYLYCFYSDDSDPAHDQRIVYKRSYDGVNWEDEVEVCAFDNAKARPGMIGLTKLGNGDYLMVYEYFGTSDGSVYFKTTPDISVWDATDEGAKIVCEDGYSFIGSPACIWTPAGGECGMLIVSGKKDFDGGEKHYFAVSFDYGNTWHTMENPLPYDISNDAYSTNRIGHSSSFCIGDDPSVILYASTTDVPETGRQRIQFARFRIIE